MRHLVITFAALILTAPATLAQPRHGGGHRPPHAPPPPTAPGPHVSVPPPIVYPLPPLMPPPAGGLTPRFGESPRFRSRTSPFFPSGSAGYGPFLFGYPEPVEPAPGQRSPLPAPATGLLRLVVTPDAAQVFVDSHYVGTVEDLNAQRVLELPAGPHRIEIRAPQHQTLAVDMLILPRETVTYRGTLEPARQTVQAAPAPAAPPTVMYVIPKCYLGNLPPRQSRLPSGCDVKQVVVLKPATATAQP